MKAIYLFAVLLLSTSLPGQVRYQDLLRGPGANWLTYAGDYASHRFSPLRQIDLYSVQSLVPAWVYHVEDSTRLETSPVVYQGIMYITDTNRIEALDARTGHSLWRYRAETVKEQEVNRGAAILGDKVFFVTTDAHLIALNRFSGNVLWDHEFASVHKGYLSTNVPLVVKDKVLVGVKGGGSGQRGFVIAMSADTGKEAWRFWTVPAKGEPGSDTWSEFPLQYGGAPTWTSGSFDPQLNLVYWTSGNPWPDYYGGGRRGDNLYSDCVVALDPDTGKMKWYFQFTPHDTHDWDANETSVLVNSVYRGRERKLLLHADRNGFYYVLDRATGEFLAAKPFVDHFNWATGVTASGRPIETPNLDPSPNGVKVCPASRGATNWMSPSYSALTGLLYVVTLEQCSIYTSSAKEPEPSSGFHGTGDEQIASEPGRFYLRALDALTGDRRWEFAMPGPSDPSDAFRYNMWAGTLATAGGLVFTGDDDGNLVALDARSGAQLWHFYTGHTLYASPVTFAVDGRQYITIAAESSIFTFALFQSSDRSSHEAEKNRR